MNCVATVPVPDQMPPAITRPRHLVEAVLAQSLREKGPDGRPALAWQWALTGTRPSPITFALPTGAPPSRAAMIAEAWADDEGPSAGSETVSAGWHDLPEDSGPVYDEDGQIVTARCVLLWLSGERDTIPLRDDDRGRFIGARGDYARTEAEIRQVRDWARSGLARYDLPDLIDPANALRPWRWRAGWMNAAWLRGVRDYLTWVLGERPDAPLSDRIIHKPSLDEALGDCGWATDVAIQGRPDGQPVQPGRYPPPMYGEAVQESADWLKGEVTKPPADQHGCGAYVACPDSGPRCTCRSECLGKDCGACAEEPCLAGWQRIVAG